MRTTWIKLSSAQEHKNNSGSGKTPVPLPRTKFMNNDPTGNPEQDGGSLPQELKREELGDQSSGTKEIIARSLTSQGKLPDASPKSSPVKGSSPAALTSPPPKPPRTFSYTSPESSPSHSCVVRPTTTPRQPPKPIRRRTFEVSEQIQPNNTSHLTSPRHHESRGTGPNRIPEEQQPSTGVSSVPDSISTTPRPMAISTPTPRADQGARSQPKNHKRLGTFVLPPLPSQPPPSPPAASQRRLAQPNSLHNNNQTNPINQSESRREVANTEATSMRPGHTSIQDTVVTPGEFECCCKEVFSRGKKARAYMENGRYMEAANEYQKALSVVDKVLKTQVLSITTDEVTRQKFFQMQSAVFHSRKEALNGFSDAQAAVATPREILPENTTPGAPPTYDDVLREDQQRTTGSRPSVPARPPQSRPLGRPQPLRCPQPLEPRTRPPQSRQPQDQPAPPSVRFREPPSARRPSREQPRAQEARPLPNTQQNRSEACRPHYARSVTHPAQDPPSHTSERPRNQGLAHRRSLSLTDGDLRTEMLVDVSDNHQSAQPLPSCTAAPLELRPLVPARMSYPRPKSHYPPREKQEVPMRPLAKSRPKSCIQPGDLSSLSNMSFQLGAGDPDGRRKLSLDIDPPVAEPSLRKDFDLNDKDAGIAANPALRTTDKETKPVEHPNNDAIDNASTASESKTPVSNKNDSKKLAEATKSSSSSTSLTGLSDNNSDEEDAMKTFGNASPSRQPLAAVSTAKDKTDHAFDDLAHECDISSSIESNFEKLILTEGETRSCEPSNLVSGSTSTDSESPTTVLDPFADIDPFVSITPKHEEGKNTFFAEFLSLPVSINKDTRHEQLSLDAQVSLEENKPHKKVDRLLTPLKPIPALVDKPLSYDSKTPEAEEEESCQSPTDEQRESLLDALDFAISQTPGHARVSPQRSNTSIKASRCRSEDTLLDCSYNTLGMYLQSANICASRASIIDEFDPLSTPADEPSESIPDKPNSAQCSDNEDCSDGMAQDFEDEPYYAEPRKILREIDGDLSENYDAFDSNFESRNVTDKALEVPTHYSAEQSSQHVYANTGGRSSVSSSVGWNTSWPSSTSSSPPPLTPSAADSWSPWEAGPSETGVGRSKFYSSPVDSQVNLPPRQVTTPEPTVGAAAPPPLPVVPPGLRHCLGSLRSDSRELLRVREGVKIFFIHDDGIVTSPWNRPYLSIVKDTKKTWLIGEGLSVFVGDALWWSCLSKKSTLVLRAESGVYLFQETAGKPDCRAVAVRVPTTVRRSQHELFARLMQENSRLEDERPSGITKAISKGASTAASRMEQIAMNKTDVVTNPPFVRRNSIRALKGVSKRLHAIVERTGYTQQELPAEYANLQDAANVLRYARTTKSIQYI
ncbi:protein piccolo-like isoform X2 [Penaeus japonicus]|uniref:protein piccolo-like isoform X2 n=1 Tax=Penaeus japonicus TaxID=27405 RepID=UPI001C71463D|nr:protein piccolo-like isoform X2 [Penaeus japonicus]